MVVNRVLIVYQVISVMSTLAVLLNKILLFRWSGDGTSLGAGGSGSGGAMDEEQGLLHGAQEPPFDSPLPYRYSHTLCLY